MNPFNLLIQNKKAVAAMALLVMSVCSISCKKAIDVGNPKTEISSDAAFANIGGATSAMLGIYASLEGYRDVNTTTLPGLSADELTSYSTPLSRYYTNSLSSSVNDDFWSKYYNCIYQANSLIIKVNASKGIGDADKRKLIAEATFLRAFFHFYLINYFGDIPYITGIDYHENSVVKRMSAKNVIYPLIIKDLLYAQANLPEDYPSADRVRANKAVASAMLARVYLYYGDVVKAEKEATAVIENPNYSLETDINLVFLRESQESILQLSPNVNTLPNAVEGVTYILDDLPANTRAKVSISDFLYNSFEPDDLRKTDWIGTFSNDGVKEFHYAFKYKSDGTVPGVEYSVVLRLAEQYLIRAEAKAEQNRVDEAVDDLAVIRERAGLRPLAHAMSKAECLAAIQQERRVELFVEWGHRWLDLKRTGNVDKVMPAVCQAKGGVWNTDWQLYPIPKVQLNADPNMTGNQNHGY